MKIAVPLDNGQFATHFGKCTSVLLVTVDIQRSMIIGEVLLESPPHAPGVFPAWLSEQGVQLVIAGGMGARALSMFSSVGIQVILGAPLQPPRSLVESYLAGRLESGANVCHHGPDHQCHHEGECT